MRRLRSFLMCSDDEFVVFLVINHSFRVSFVHILIPDLHATNASHAALVLIRLA